MVEADKKEDEVENETEVKLLQSNSHLNEKKVELVPPDGGYGWVILIAYIIAGVTAIPIIQNFGLVYKERLKELGIKPTQLTFIISMNSSLGQILGVFQGPLLKRLSCRIMAVVGVSFLSIGTLLTSFSQNFTHFVLTHGVITSIGFTYTLTSFGMAMHSYFRANRSRASGWVMGFTGIGPVIMPLFVTYSLDTYGVFWTGILLAALNSHGLIGASLLQPVERHLIPAKNKCTTENNQLLPNVDAESMIGIEPMNGFDPSRRKSSEKIRIRSISQSEDNFESSDEALEDSTRGSVSQLKKLQEEEEEEEEGIHHRPDGLLHSFPGDEEKRLSEHQIKMKQSIETLQDISFYLPSKDCKEAKSSANGRLVRRLRRVWNILHKEFDLDLLKDPTYVNITVGMSIAVIGELIFSMLTPFILAEIGLDLQQSAYFMSAVAVTDIVARFVSPYIGEFVKLSSRWMYILALFFLLFSRASLLLVSNKAGLIAVALFIGFAKGVRTVFWGQVLPDHVPIRKLGSAMSIQNFVNGIFIFFAGPISGVIVEINNSYLNIIYVSNALTGFTVILWGMEWLICKFKNKCNCKS